MCKNLKWELCAELQFIFICRNCTQKNHQCSFLLHKFPTPLCKKINFRQNTEMWTQPMRTGTQNLTQAQDPESYTQSIQMQISLANKPHVSGKCSTLAWITDAVLLCRALFCFVWNLFFSIIGYVLLGGWILCKHMKIKFVKIRGCFLATQDP